MGVLEITAIVTAVTAVIGVAAAIFLRQRQATHQASDGGVTAPDNKGVVETRRDTTVHGQGTSADHAQSVSIQHIYGFATEGRDSLRRMEATMDELRSEVANLAAVVSSKTIKATKETDDPETLRERAGREFEKGEYEAGRQHSEQALVLSQADPDADLQLQFDILVDLLEAATDVHNIRDSLRYHRRAAELAERSPAASEVLRF